MGIILGLGLGLPFGGQQSGPQQILGSSLLGYWDAERADSLSLSGTSVTTWTDLVGSYAATQAISGSKPRYDANAFGGVLNKCTNVNANPQNTTGLTKSGDAASVLSVVDDSAALAAAGLSAYGPNVIKLDNSLGVTSAAVAPTGTVGNTNAHAAVAWVRGGTGGLKINSGGTLTAFAASATYQRRPRLEPSPATSASGMFVQADAGQTVYFILNGLYEGSSAPTGDVVVNGAAAYGFGRPGVIFDGSDDELTYAGVGAFPVGASGGEIWALVDQQLAPADTTNRRGVSYGANSANTSRQLHRSVNAGVNRASSFVGNGAASVSAENATVDLSGRHVARLVVSATDARVDVDATAGTPAAVVPATGSTRTRLGANTSDAAGGFWQGQLSTVIITGPLSTDQAAQLTAYLKARGGIA